jgi:hypothetical protein
MAGFGGFGGIASAAGIGAASGAPNGAGAGRKTGPAPDGSDGLGIGAAIGGAIAGPFGGVIGASIGDVIGGLGGAGAAAIGAKVGPIGNGIGAAMAAMALPRPMAADCKVVHGQCPGPDNHVLCQTHRHVLDTNTHMIIAESVPDYVKHHMPKAAAHPDGHDEAAGHGTHGQSTDAKAAPGAEGVGAGVGAAIGMALGGAVGAVAGQGMGAAIGAGVGAVISAAAGRLPKPMASDCKVVHGQCPGPNNHVLCQTHHHVLDTDTHMIIADSVADYVKHHMPKAAAHGHESAGKGTPGQSTAANATQGASKTTQVPPTTHAGPAAAAAPASGPPAASHPAGATSASGPSPSSAAPAAGAPAAPAPDEAAITKGIGVVFVSAKDDLTARHGLINDEIELWVNQSATMIENMDGDASSVASMILKVVDIVLTVVVPEAKEFQIIVAEVGNLVKMGQMMHDANSASDAEKAKSAIQQVRASASKAIEANGKAKDLMLPIVQTTLSLLRDADSLQRLARGAPDDILVMAQRAGVPNKAQINGARTKLRAGLRHELRNWLKQAAMDKEKNALEGSLLLLGKNDEDKAKLLAEKMVEYEVQWGKDYDDHQESKMLDEDVEIAIGRR